MKTEHLKQIKAECERLLALSEKRTQGEWALTAPEPEDLQVHVCHSRGEMVAVGVNTSTANSEANAAYIAACAGRAEAGWRSTIAAINGIEEMEYSHLYEYILDNILAAWPLELLKNVERDVE